MLDKIKAEQNHDLFYVFLFATFSFYNKISISTNDKAIDCVER